MLAAFRVSAFRLETRDHYALDYEQAEFDQFLAGSPEPPPEVSWWRPWLDRIGAFTAAGKTIGRVRVISDPPSDYQRWEIWAAPWHAAAGEQIGYLSRERAEGIGLSVALDWWLLDDERLILMYFTGSGEIDHKELITDPGTVARHRAWRDLAVRNATPAEEIAAA